MLINLRNALMGGKRTPTAKDYVQDGLVAMWDGIENAGWGVHDANATTWVNLAGGSIDDVELYTQNCEWASDALIGKSRAFVSSSTELALGSCPMPNSYKTGEFVVKFGNIACILFAKGSPSNGNAVVGRLNATRGLQLAYVNTTGGVAHSADVRYYASRTGDSFSEGGSCYKNGEPYSGGFNRMNLTGINRFGAGYNTNAGNALPFIGEICTMRFYSRALTADEIAHNYAIDKARFGLP